MHEIVLRFKDLKKSFDQHQVLKGITISAGRGEVIGLIGLNGSGKTTLLETALGFSPPSAGQAYLFGKNSMTELDEATKGRIGFVPQREELLHNINGEQYLNLVAAFYKHWNNELVAKISREWDIPLTKKIAKLSEGQKQKLAIVSSLGHEPELLILDEPVASLDPVARRQFLKQLIEMSDRHQQTVIFSTHIVSDLERVASRVWLLKDGIIAVDEALDALKEHSVRIHLAPGLSIPDNFLGEDLLFSRSRQGSHTLICRNWNPALQNKLEQELASPVTPESLSLEDIFLEVHA